MDGDVAGWFRGEFNVASFIKLLTGKKLLRRGQRMAAARARDHSV